MSEQDTTDLKARLDREHEAYAKMWAAQIFSAGLYDRMLKRPKKQNPLTDDNNESKAD